MNKEDTLFLINGLERPLIGKKKIKKIPLEQWEKWEMNENFIRALHAMNTDKIYVFRIVYRKGVMYYNIKQKPYDFSSNRITADDIDILRGYFEDNGWEVDSMYFESVPANGFELSKSLKGLYIRGKNE
jgi:hypothetical protein